MSDAAVTDTEAATAFRARSRKRGSRQLAIMGARLGLLVAMLASWEVCARSGVIDEGVVSMPSAIAVRLVELGRDGRLTRDVSITLFETFAGLVVGATLGIAAGAALSFGKTVADILEPFIIAFYSLPRIALAPLFIVWFGIGTGSKVAFAASMVFFLTLLSTYMGMKQTDANLLLAVKALGATRRQLLTRVCIPYAVPWIISALKTGIGMSLIGTIVGEFIAASSGVGWYISYTGGQYDSTGVMAGIVVLAVMSFLLNGLVRRLEGALLKWKPEVTL